MTENELILWKRFGQGDETARKELILAYLPLVDVWAKRISRAAGWADWEDLRQNGVMGLMKAIERFDFSRGVEFIYFARPFIRGSILDSPELTRDLARQQEEICRKIKRAESELTERLQRIPSVEDIADKTGFTPEQMRNAIDAMGIAFAGAFPDSEDPASANLIETAHPDTALMVQDALSLLSERESFVIIYYYLEDQSPQEIAEKLELTVSNVTKIRQRAIIKLRGLLDI
ncbi:MAG: sigma-70 family RNA polymerase sigma factor [Blastocatellia bacterium]